MKNTLDARFIQARFVCVAIGSGLLADIAAPSAGLTGRFTSLPFTRNFLAMCGTAIAALEKRGYTLNVDSEGYAFYVLASNLKLTQDDVQNLGALGRLHDLTLFHCAHDDSIWPILARMPGLEELTLTAGFGNETKGPSDVAFAGFEDPPVWRMGVTDNGSEHLRQVPKLKLLDLGGTSVGDATLVQIGQLASLEKLDLTGTRVTSAGLAHLRGLRRLKELSLVQTAVDDDGLASISELKGLTRLWLESTKITDVGLAHVGGLPALERLSIHNTAATERGLIRICSLKHLETLYVGSPITAGGVGHLRELTSLYDLYIGDSIGGRDMTESEIDFVKSELPKVIVEY